MKRILIHTLTFYPDAVSTAYIYNDIASSLKEYGYDVIVVTSTPHYNIIDKEDIKRKLKWKILGFLKSSDYKGIRVLHIPQYKFKSKYLRILGFFYWHFVSMVTCLFQKKIDLILSPSPPLTIGLLNIFIAKIKRSKVIYNVQEIYPDILNLRKSLILNILKSLECYIYNHTDAIVTIDKVFYETIINRVVKKSKVIIIPNFVDTDTYKPLKLNNTKTLYNENNCLKLLYAGNIGYSQDWDLLIKLAIHTKTEPIEYYIIGDGVNRKQLENKIKESQLTNIYLFDYQPREQMPKIIAHSDINFIFMNKNDDSFGFPSKIYTIMACSKPLLVSTIIHSPSYNFLNNLNCSLIFTEVNDKLKIDKITKTLLSISKNEIEKLGFNGYNEIIKNYSKDIVCTKYINLINETLS